jgi:hypothetical protein
VNRGRSKFYTTPRNVSPPTIKRNKTSHRSMRRLTWSLPKYSIALRRDRGHDVFKGSVQLWHVLELVDAMGHGYLALRDLHHASDQVSDALCKQ